MFQICCLKWRTICCFFLISCPNSKRKISSFSYPMGYWCQTERHLMKGIQWEFWLIRMMWTSMRGIMKLMWQMNSISSPCWPSCGWLASSRTGPPTGRSGSGPGRTAAGRCLLVWWWTGTLPPDEPPPSLSHARR